VDEGRTGGADPRFRASRPVQTRAADATAASALPGRVQTGAEALTDLMGFPVNSVIGKDAN